MQVLTKQQVLQKIENFCKPYTTYAAAAKAIGCTQAQLSDARNDSVPVCPKILKKLGLTREMLYVSNVEEKYKDGSMKL